MCIRDSLKRGQTVGHGPVGKRTTRLGRYERGRLQAMAAEVLGALGKVLQREAGVVAVSYTHLDVYKRQGDGAAARIELGQIGAEGDGEDSDLRASFYEHVFLLSLIHIFHLSEPQCSNVLLLRLLALRLVFTAMPT